MQKPVILTGIRSNENPTIGNYFGAIMPLIDMAKNRSDEFQVNIFVPDLHSFTTPVNYDTLYEQTLYNIRVFIAAGFPLTDNDLHIYRQSFISAHSELTWILDCFTGMGEMERMTQFKEKSKSQDLYSRVTARIEQLKKIQIDNQNLDSEILEASNSEIDFLLELGGDSNNKQQVSVGLFNYPVLMAADILLYNAQYIPVGDDQTQHLEFARDIAERINNKFGNIFTVPESVKKQHEFFGNEQGLRIKDLIDPTKKMSKSDESGRGVIFLADTPEVAHKKIMGATTDDKASVHFDRKNQPGISNLLEILSLLRGHELAQTVAEFEGQTRYGDFKKVVADEVAAFLTDFHAKLAAIDDDEILAKLERSETELRTTANATLLRAQQAVGLRAKA